MRIDRLSLGMVGTNCYLAINEELREMVVIDPADSPELIEARIRKTGAAPKAVLLTHGHFDHIGAADALRKKYGIPVMCMRPEQAVLSDPQCNLTGTMGRGSYTLRADELLEDGQVLTLAGLKFRALLTPGHTAGGGCYYFEDEAVVFAGDTLFQNSVGRTDFPTGSMSELVRSIKEKLLTLPDETKVLPGHGLGTRIDWERDYNPYLG